MPDTNKLSPQNLGGLTLQKIANQLNIIGSGTAQWDYLPSNATPEQVEEALKKFQMFMHLATTDGTYDYETQFHLDHMAQEMEQSYNDRQAEELKRLSVITRLNKIKSKFYCDWDDLPDFADDKTVRHALSMFQVYAGVHSNQDGYLDEETDEKLNFYANFIILGPSHMPGNLNKPLPTDIFGLAPFTKLLNHLAALEEKYPCMKHQIRKVRQLVGGHVLVGDLEEEPSDVLLEDFYDWMGRLSNAYPMLSTVVDAFKTFVTVVEQGFRTARAAALAEGETPFWGPMMLIVSAALGVLATIIYVIEGIACDNEIALKRGLLTIIQSIYMLIEGMTVLTLEVIDPVIGSIIGIAWLMLDLLVINGALEEVVMGTSSCQGVFAFVNHN